MAVATELHGFVWDLRRVGIRLIKQADADPDQVVVAVLQITSLLPTLSGKSIEQDGVVRAIHAYCNQAPPFMQNTRAP